MSIDPLVLGILGLAMLLVLLLFGIHIGVALALVGVIGTGLITKFDLSLWMLVGSVFYIVAKFTYITVPLFILAGLLASRGAISKNLYNAISVFAGNVKGALAIATVASCTAFGLLCGSSLVTAMVFAKVSVPEMVRHGYEKKLAYGLVSTAGIIGMLIPPSILAVVYAALTQESIGKLFIAGIGPGLLLAAIMVAGIIVMAKIRPQDFGTITANPLPWRQRLPYLKHFWIVAFVGVVLVGGILAGVFTATEAAAIASFVLIVVVLATTGRGRLGQLKESLFDTVITSGMVFFVIGSAGVFGKFMAFSGVSTQMVSVVVNLHLSSYWFLGAMCVVYIILGCFLDSVSMLSLTIPIVYPTVIAMGIDPIWFAMTAILAVESGLITPPFALNVFAVKSVADPDVTLQDIFRGAFPFFIMTLVVLILVILFPPVTTYLPSLAK